MTHNFFSVTTFTILKFYATFGVQITNLFVSVNCIEMLSGLDIVIVLDSSASVGLANWELVKQYVVNLILENKSKKVQFGLVVFSSRATVQFTLDQYSDINDLQEAVYSIPYSPGGTNLADAMMVAREQIFKQAGNRKESWDVLILIIDGAPNINIELTASQIALTKEEGMIIYAVGIGPDVDIQQLTSTANEPDFMLLTDFEVLNRAPYPLMDAICENDLFSK